MDYQTLQNNLAINNGTATVSRNAFGPVIKDFFDTYYQGQPLIVSDATPATGDGAKATAGLTGRATFLGVADLPISARLSLDDSGETRSIFTYTLRDKTPGPAAWTFSYSFTDLPTVWDYTTGFPVDEVGAELEAYQVPFVEALDLFDTRVVVTSHAQNDAELGVPLEPGINFVSKVRPQGMAGVLEHALRAGPHLSLYGSIKMPKVNDVTLPLKPSERVWDRPDAPGIHLAAPLPLDFTMGKLVFDQAALRIYTPLSTDWQDANPTFRPLHGYSGRLAIPSAGITINLAADLQWGLPYAYLSADCKGITLGKLAHLLDLCGTDSLSEHLPEPIQKAVEKLEKLELLYVALMVNTAGIAPSVGTAIFTVGMPDLRWKVWGDHLEVESIACRFEVSNPFAGASGAGGGTKVAVTVTGVIDIEGVPVLIEARTRNSFAVTASLGQAQKVPLESLMKVFEPSVHSPANLTVGALSIMMAPGSSYAMSMLIADGSNPWTIPVGKSSLTISDVLVSMAYPKGGPFYGSFAGTAKFGKDLSLSVAYTLPGDVTLRGAFNDIKLGKLVAELCDLPGGTPKDFDLTLSQASVLVQKRGSDYVFQLGAAMDGFGALAFEAQKTGSQWGFAVGMDLAGGKIAKIPGLSVLKAIEDVVRLDKLLLVISAVDNANFQFPDLAQFNSPRLGAKSLALPATARGVSKGLMIFAEWKLDPKDQKHALLMTLLGLGSTQQVTIAVAPNPAAGTKLFFAERTKLQGHPFDYQLGFMLTAGQASMFLMGTLTIRIQDQPQTFDTTMAFVPTGMFLAASMKGSAPVDCKLFKLSNLALEIGVNWGGIPSLGIMGSIVAKNFESSIAIFFDSTNPARSLVAGSVSRLTLKDVVDTLLGGVVPSVVDDALAKVLVQGTHQFKIAGDLADELDNRDIAKIAAAFGVAKVTIPGSPDQVSLSVSKRGSAWFLTDMSTMRHYALVKRGNDIEVSVEAQFYWAPQPTFIGSIKFPQGYYLNAAIDIFGFKASATIDIQAFKGIAIDAQMDKIVVGGEKVFSITAAVGGGGPRVSISSFLQPADPTPEFRLPHIYINGCARLLGLELVVFANVTASGVALELKGMLVPGVSFDLDATFGGSELAVDGDIKVGIGSIDLGELGKIKVNTDVEGSLGVRVSGQKVDIAAEASFEFLGDEVKIGHFTIDSSPDALATIGKKMEQKVEQELRKIFSDVGRWTSAISGGLVDGVDDTEKVLKNVYKKSEKEAKAMANDVGKGAKTAEKTVEKGTQTAEKTVEKGVSKFGKKLKKLF